MREAVIVSATCTGIRKAFCWALDNAKPLAMVGRRIKPISECAWAKDGENDDALMGPVLCSDVTGIRPQSEARQAGALLQLSHRLPPPNRNEGRHIPASHMVLRRITIRSSLWPPASLVHSSFESGRAIPMECPDTIFRA